MMKIKVGLETHLMLSSKRKLFCQCRPNLDQCSVCRGTPGSLPRSPSQQILSKASTLSNALNCTTTPKLTFYRKHYNYVDLPNGYQRTQLPLEGLAQSGHLKLVSSSFDVPIRSLYLEEDPASIEKYAVCYKRCGNPLVEIVTTPCFIGTPKQVGSLVTEYLRTVIQLAIDLDLCNVAKSIKTDVNVSLLEGAYRYEIKNLTSISDIRRSLVSASKLLLTETESNKTFHFKNKLVFSRSKTEYLYTREYNLPSLDVPPSTPNRLTLHQIYGLIHKRYPHPTAYAYAKLVTPIVQADPTKLQKYLCIDPLKGLAQFKLKKSTRLEEEVASFVTAVNLTKQDYLQKTTSFRGFMDKLKQQLVHLQVPFNSLTINTELARIFL